MTESHDQDKRGLTRREILKRGAIVGGAALWTTPAVQVMRMTGAGAQDADASPVVTTTVTRPCICEPPPGANVPTSKVGDNDRYFFFQFDDGSTCQGTSKDKDIDLADFGCPGFSDEFHISCSDEFGYGDKGTPGLGDKGSPKAGEPKVTDFYIAKFDKDTNSYTKDVCCLRVLLPDCTGDNGGPCVFPDDALARSQSPTDKDKFYYFLFDNGEVLQGILNDPDNNVNINEPGKFQFADTFHISCSDKFGFTGKGPKGQGEKGSPNAGEPLVVDFYIAEEKDGAWEIECCAADL